MAGSSKDSSALDPSKISLEQVPHEGNVVLQQASGQQPALVRHSVTLETKHLPKSDGAWALVFQDGFGAVTNTESGVVIELDDLFTRNLHADSNGHLFIVEQQQKQQQQKVWSLREKQCQSV